MFLAGHPLLQLVALMTRSSVISGILFAFVLFESGCLGPSTSGVNVVPLEQNSITPSLLLIDFKNNGTTASTSLESRDLNTHIRITAPRGEVLMDAQKVLAPGETWQAHRDLLERGEYAVQIEAKATWLTYSWNGLAERPFDPEKCKGHAAVQIDIKMEGFAGINGVGGSVEGGKACS